MFVQVLVHEMLVRKMNYASYRAHSGVRLTKGRDFLHNMDRAFVEFGDMDNLQVKQLASNTMVHPVFWKSLRTATTCGRCPVRN